MEAKEQRDFLRGNVLADFMPFYNYRRHFPKQGMEYVLDMHKSVDNFFELGILTHFVADFVCTPHFKNWRFYSANVVKHVKFEKTLEKVSAGFNFSAVDVQGIQAGRTGCINDKVLALYANAGEAYDDNLKSAYLSVFSMLENFLK